MIHKLPDGRDLGYAEFGDLNGTPVFFIHGAPGSRLFHPPDNVTKHQNVHLICTDRPGYGDSTFQPNRRFLDWPKDIVSLADALKLDKFAMVGHSGGSPHALACAYGVPERITGVAIIAGAGPVDAPDATEGITMLHWLGLKFGQYIPWTLWRLIIGWVFREVGADPTKSLDRDRDSRPLVDNEIFDIPEIRELCIQSDLEAYRHGLLAFAWDTRLLTRPWGFNLNEIKVPVHLWHGTLDNSTTMAMARYMSKNIPNSDLTVCKGEGHMLLIPHWEEILTTLKQMKSVS